MAHITKRLCLPVGQYQKPGAQKPTIDYREIGYELEFEDGHGNTWSEIRLHADVLNPVLFAMARQMMDKGSSTARVKKFDLERKKKGPAAEGEEAGAAPADDDIPY
jgi:hypothetical protein